jgi:hypothetical protein
MPRGTYMNVPNVICFFVTLFYRPRNLSASTGGFPTIYGLDCQPAWIMISLVLSYRKIFHPAKFLMWDVSVVIFLHLYQKSKKNLGLNRPSPPNKSQ